jgi:2-hydroxy-6-oxonona-2,4-dienedioate hydrolase
MARVIVNGSTIVYEVIGDGPPVILTPGGRFGKDIEGLRPLADELARSMTVVLWDRPNTGASDLKFTGESESQMAADDLVGLLEALDLAPAVLAGGSAGSRVSLIAAVRHPATVRKLVLWSMSGGRFGTMFLAMNYLLPHIASAWLEGMPAVTELPDMQESIRANPTNERLLLDQDRDEFITTLTRWLAAYIPRDDQPLPGVDAADVRAIEIPTLIVRNGDRDIYHPSETSLEVHELIAGSVLVEPPWGRNGWFETKQRVAAGRGALFDNWHLLAPTILDFALA